MSVVCTPAEGAELVRQMMKYDGVRITLERFGELYFVVDVSNCTVADAETLVDELNGVHDEISVYISSANCIDFNYCVTADLLPALRGIVNHYMNYGAQLLAWSYGVKFPRP